MRPSALGGEPAELDQARLLGVELQAELRERVAEVCPEPQRIAPVLESHHEVIGETHDQDLAARVPTSPLVSLQIKDVVQVHVRQQWRY